ECYEDPIGKCVPSGVYVTGCWCKPGSAPLPYYNGTELIAVVCSMGCYGNKACPPYPHNPPECMSFGELSVCGIPCSSEADCPDEGYCADFGEYGTRMCMYKV
ncbi:hypothetical protein FOL47_009146, partial [Perkinsus chesapeaki]